MCDEGTTPAGSPAPEPDATYLRFRDAVERDFARTRRVEDYAEALGYSARSLARATLAAADLGAKEFIGRRVVLEAKRLLAHSDHSAARIADGLGFSGATHFNTARGRTGAPWCSCASRESWERFRS